VAEARTTTYRQSLGPMARALALLAFLLLGALVFAGRSQAEVESPPPPQVWSDKADYAPGETVTLSGANWAPGESVHIRVNDDAGETWRRDVDVVADENGALTDQFNLPDWFVAVYNVTATGASSGTATWSFTDASLAIHRGPTGNPPNVTFTVTYQPFSNNTCTTGGGPIRTAIVNNDAGTNLGGLGSGQGGFVKITAPGTPSPSNYTFKNWSSVVGSNNTITTTTSTFICVRNPAGAQDDAYRATYEPANTAPAIAADNATVTVSEGQSAANTGTWSDANAGDTVTLSASVGTVTKAGTNASGTWSWSYATSDGPDDSQTVTITANDGTTTSSTTFSLVVNNAAPVVTLNGEASANEGQTKSYSFTVTDPGNDPISAVSASCGANGTKSNESIAADKKSGSFDCTFPDGPASSTVSVSATDTETNPADQLTGSASKVVSIANVAPTVTFSATNDTSVDEGAAAHTYAFSVSDPGADGFTVDAHDCGLNGDLVASSLTTSASGGSFKCVFPDGPASSSVHVKVSDSDGASDTDSEAVQIVAIANVAPVVTLTGAASADEGDLVSYSYSTNDPGDEVFNLDSESCGANGSLSNSSFDPDTGSGSFDCTFPDGPASSTVSVSVSDGNDSDSDSIEVTVANVAPTVTFSATNDTSVDEGAAAHTYSYTIFDPGADMVSAVSTSCDPPEGEKVSGSDTNTNTSGSFQCRFPDGPAAADLTGAATDSDGETGATAHQSVHVNNVAPTVTFSPANETSVDEGTTHTYVFSVSDPGNDTFTVDSHSCGTHGEFVTGTLTTSASGGSFQCRFPDGPNSSNVSVRVSDSDGASDTDSEAVQVVAIANVAPTVELSGPAAANEGDTKTYTYTVSDPGDDPNPTITESCGANGTKTDTPAAMSFDCTFPEGPASSTVKVTADDGDPSNNVGSDEIGVSVANVPPDVDLAGDGSANEGQTKSYSYSWTDPGASDTFTRSVSCGPKGVVSNQAFTPSSKTGSFDCTFGDDSGGGTFEVKVTVTDDDGGAGSHTRNVDVDNVNPTASHPSFVFDPVLGTATAGFDFSDVGWLDTHGPNLSFFTWSDVGNRFASVTEVNSPPNATGHASDTRIFAPGCFNLTVTGTAKDDDAGTSAPLAIHSDSSTAVFARGFRPPIMDNERNIAKYGNVVPVKVLLTNTCTGATVTNVSLYITTVQGSGSEIIESTNVVAESVSAADGAGGQMRTADGMYIYNLSTKSMQAGKDYTVRIRYGSSSGPVILAAVLYPKK
jgi:hypothetical protein